MFVKDKAKISSRVGVSSEELCILASWLITCSTACYCASWTRD